MDIANRPFVIAVIAALLPVVSPFLTASFAHPPAILSSEQRKAAEEEIRAFRKALAEAITAKNAARLAAMYAESFVHTHADGRLEGRDGRIASAMAGVPVIETVATEDLVIRVPGGWTAIATGRSRMGSPDRGQDYEVRWTAVYVRAELGWQLAAGHESRAGGGM